MIGSIYTHAAMTSAGFAMAWFLQGQRIDLIKLQSAKAIADSAKMIAERAYSAKAAAIKDYETQAARNENVRNELESKLKKLERDFDGARVSFNATRLRIQSCGGGVSTDAPSASPDASPAKWGVDGFLPAFSGGDRKGN